MYRIQHRNNGPHRSPGHPTVSPLIPSLDFREMPAKPSNMGKCQPRMIPICLPINDEFGAYKPKPRPAPQCRRESSVTVAASEPYESPRPLTSYSDPRVANLQTQSPRSPENRKIKTEMCKNMLTHGHCVWGPQCLFAHSEEERMKFETVEEMAQYGLVNRGDLGVFLTRPCLFFVSTGSCPYNTRCKSLHDPRLRTPSTTPSWLEHYTKYNKKDPTLILDRLHHFRMNAISQVNPLVEGWVWNECRGDGKVDASALDGNKRQDTENDESIWKDTYRLVCNWDVPIFPSQATKQGSNALMSYSNVVNRNIVHKLSELQKLCIVLAMRRPSKMASGNGHCANLDYIYEPTHCLNAQPCMILQLRFFRLLDYCQKRVVSSISDVVEEISMLEYHGLSSNLTVRACEVVMDSKGKRSANWSIFFDVDITPCSNNKAKRVSKKGEEHWQLEDKTVFCMPKNESFSAFLPPIKPYIMMQPVDDVREGHEFIDAILEHRIVTLLHLQGCQFDKLTAESLIDREMDIKSKFILLMNQLKRASWPVTKNMDHIKKTTEERNRTAYYPSDVEGSGSAHHLWNSFVSNLGSDRDPPATSSKRLPIFRSITAKRERMINLPHIKHKKRAQQKSEPNASSISEATWKELLEGHSGAWAAARYSHETKNGQVYTCS
ncbi:hypothetical protein HJC23_001754 [Cyclotella cryptica]|uniref:C3H1-type domain-containing protein n=1 Tax=Cyclotella cryptica TaxID=29204 RepID=A0ABD3QPC9_9STRA|eukprot:CCRYP_003316-RA/>CCRYP_003316-RA protein AED:0.13 eAED:0.13 QI:77/1/0.6/1/0.75/0.8/5/0/662